MVKGVPHRDVVSDALHLAEEWGLDTAIFAMPQVRREHLTGFVNRASLSFPHVIVIPDLAGATTSAHTPSRCTDSTTGQVRTSPDGVRATSAARVRAPAST